MERRSSVTRGVDRVSIEYRSSVDRGSRHEKRGGTHVEFMWKYTMGRTRAVVDKQSKASYKLLNACETKSARLPSQGTHWKTMKERTGNLCQNVRGRARKKLNAEQKTEGKHVE